jgi:prepilin-type N-terminal cleavage/methylation domain-containing protein
MKLDRTEGQSGLSLIELLVTITILGLAVTAVLGGMTTLLSTSGLHRQQADVTAVVESAAEAVKADPYANCATTYAVPTATLADASITTIQITYWNPSGTGFQPSCPGTDQGLQMVAIKAKQNNGSVSQTLSLVKASGQP